MQPEEETKQLPGPSCGREGGYLKGHQRELGAGMVFQVLHRHPLCNQSQSVSAVAPEFGDVIQQKAPDFLIRGVRGCTE